MKLVHVISPGGSRYEFHFPQKASSDAILQVLYRNRWQFGYNKSVAKSEHGLIVHYADRNSGLVWDHPNTRIVVGQDLDGKFQELEVIRESQGVVCSVGSKISSDMVPQETS